MLDQCSWNRLAHRCLSRQRCRELWLIAVSWSLNCCYEVAVWLLTFYQLISDHENIKKTISFPGRRTIWHPKYPKLLGQKIRHFELLRRTFAQKRLSFEADCVCELR
jgi:hypothetical protein